MRGSNRVTSETVERNIRQQRLLDEQRRDLAAFGKENANLMSVASSQAKIEQQRRITQQIQSRNERIAEENMKKSAYDKTYRELTSFQNQALATELEKETAADERKRREIQKICEDAPELRDLERQLKIAYLNKERSVQYEEKVMLAMREQERIQAIEDEMEAERIRMIQTENNRDQAKRAQYENQRKVLLQQIEERKQRLAEARRQIEHEREMVDDIVRKINLEDEADYRNRKDKQAATAEMVRRFEDERKRQLEAQRAAEKAEEDRILAYQRAMDARNEGIEAKKQAKRDEEDRILRQIVEETERKRKEEEEFNNLRDMLWEEELEAKRTQDALERKMKQVRMKEEMLQVNSEMMKFKELQRLREAENEAKLVNMMRRKFAEDEAKERADEENRRMSKMHYMTMIEKQKDERKYLFDQERAEEMRLQQEALDREEYRKRVIQEARNRLLQEHAERLRGFLPNKIFESREEFEQYRDYAR